MGHYLRLADGSFMYNPTIKRSTLRRDYQRTVPIRPMVAGKRRRTWEKKKEPGPPILPKRVYEYTIFSKEYKGGPRDTFEARTTLELDPDDDPYSAKNRRKAKARTRRGYDRLYMEQIGKILDDPKDRGIRQVSGMMEGVEVGTIGSGRMYRSVEGRAVEVLNRGMWRQTRWVKKFLKKKWVWRLEMI